MTGWLVPAEGNTFSLVNPEVFFTDCDGKGVRVAEPLAALRLSDLQFWILQEHGYEDESYVIAEIRAAKIRYPIRVSGGGC